MKLFAFRVEEAVKKGSKTVTLNAKPLGVDIFAQSTTYTFLHATLERK